MSEQVPVGVVQLFSKNETLLSYLGKPIPAFGSVPQRGLTNDRKWEIRTTHPWATPRDAAVYSPHSTVTISGTSFPVYSVEMISDSGFFILLDSKTGVYADAKGSRMGVTRFAQPLGKVTTNSATWTDTYCWDGPLCRGEMG